MKKKLLDLLFYIDAAYFCFVSLFMSYWLFKNLVPHPIWVVHEPLLSQMDYVRGKVNNLAIGWWFLQLVSFAARRKWLEFALPASVLVLMVLVLFAIGLSDDPLPPPLVMFEGAIVLFGLFLLRRSVSRKMAEHSIVLGCGKNH